MDAENTASLPLYAQVEAALVASITDGSLPSGSQLPPEDGLMRRFGVSRTTIRTTIQHLAQRGLVEIRRGKGTYVTLPKITQDMTALTGFVEDMDALGRHASARLVCKEIVPADETVARQLALVRGTLVVRICRVRLADGMPLSFDETFLPRDLGEKVMTDDLESQPIFTLLEQKYATPLLEAEYKLEAICAEPVVADALQIASGSAIFLIERTSYSEGNRPVDYEKLHYRGDQVRFVTRLARRSTTRT
ncbi:MAG TPA: GntR family transcriptional regulator [Rhizomicrobium sp.]|jgi:GntR family transcriptional regulator